MQNDRVLSYTLATDITHQEMLEVSGGNGIGMNHTLHNTIFYTHPIGEDFTLDSDASL